MTALRIDKANWPEHGCRKGDVILNTAGIEVGEIAGITRDRRIHIRYFARTGSDGIRTPEVFSKRAGEFHLEDWFEKHGLVLLRDETRRPKPKRIVERSQRTGLPTRSRAARDARLPKNGTILTAEYHGQTWTAIVIGDREFHLDRGREDEGLPGQAVTFRSLSALAKEITGCATNGFRFFGLGGAA